MNILKTDPLKATPTTHAPCRGSVLLVDDDPMILEMVGGRLRLEGLAVFTATRAESALATLQKVTVNLIILDISMPGLGGLGFLKRMAELFRPPPAPVIVFSARHEMESFFTGTDVAAFFPKTCAPEVFIQSVLHHVAQHRQRQPRSTGSEQLKVLLVEDDHSLRRHLTYYLTHHGLVVLDIPNGLSLREAAMERRPDAALIKYFLPHHNGPALAEQLATYEPTRHIPVVIYDESGLHTRPHKIPHVSLLVPSAQDTLLLDAVREVVAAPPNRN